MHFTPNCSTSTDIFQMQSYSSLPLQLIGDNTFPTEQCAQNLERQGLIDKQLSVGSD
jgi:hypothetical protein